MQQHNHSQSNEENSKNMEQETGNATVYTCPMHPEVVSDKPGNCPKCGMKLVPKKTRG